MIAENKNKNTNHKVTWKTATAFAIASRPGEDRGPDFDFDLILI